jgi:hypothetical protein
MLSTKKFLETLTSFLTIFECVRVPAVPHGVDKRTTTCSQECPGVLVRVLSLFELALDEACLLLPRACLTAKGSCLNC